MGAEDPIVPSSCGSFAALPQWDAEALRISQQGPMLPIVQWRSEPKSSRGNKYTQQKIEGAIQTVLAKLGARSLLPFTKPRALDSKDVASLLDWNALPASLDPKAMMEGQKTDQRGRSCSVRI